MTHSTKTDRRTFISLGIGALALGAIPAGLRRRPALVRRRIPVMGTVAEVAIPTRNEPWAQRAIQAAFTELRRVDATMSRFRGDSDIGRVNGASGSWTDVSTDTAFVLQEARRWAARSGGRFDPCLGRLSALWDVGRRTAPPDSRDLAASVPTRGWRALEIDEMGPSARVRLDGDRSALDLGGIAKGFAVDLAAEALRGFGVTDGLINAGGDLVALGSDAGGRPWSIGIREPRSPEEVISTAEITDGALATSGDYLRYFEHGGRRYHHLLDPVSGQPRRVSTRSLTVRADRCLDADAAATALFGSARSDSDRVLRSAPTGTRIIHHITEETT